MGVMWSHDILKSMLISFLDLSLERFILSGAWACQISLPKKVLSQPWERHQLYDLFKSEDLSDKALVN